MSLSQNGYLRRGLQVLLILTPTVLFVAAHEDSTAPLASVEKVYEAPGPLGRIKSVYSASDRTSPILKIECNLFNGTVPSEGLTDLPRPDWSQFTVAYSLAGPSRGGGSPQEPY